MSEKGHYLTQKCSQSNGDHGDNSIHKYFQSCNLIGENNFWNTFLP